MNLRSILDRIIEQVDATAYLTPSSHVDPRQRAALASIAAELQAPDLDVAATRRRVHDLFEAGKLDRVHMLSALHVIAASPRVADWAEAARLAGEQEFAALELGGPNLQVNLASVDRHRGVVAFLRGHYEAALDHFSRALERQRTAENLGNVLCTLVRLREHDEARALLRQIRGTLPAPIVAELDDMIRKDPDLTLLREEA